MSAATIGFIGAGQMARALARGFVAADLLRPTDLMAADPIEAALTLFQSEIPGAHVAAGNAQVVERCELVVLATKPQSLPRVSEELRSVAKQGRLFVSILAGVPLEALCHQLGTQRVVRVMPNTPCLVGCGASAYALGPAASAEDAARVKQLLEAVGLALQVDEPLLDAVTGLSGSGPAYVYMVIEALSDGGVQMGLPRATALALAAQTVLGAAQMVLETQEHPGVLKDRVTSPAGTTVAGLQALERRALRAALMEAVEAATLRARELGNR